MPMFNLPGTARWEGRAKPQQGSFSLMVRAVAADGTVDEEMIVVTASSDEVPDGGIGAWPEKHILGTQLGPNKNGRKW
jgi:3',5'-cyclic-AMP phosphodiesterase